MKQSSKYSMWVFILFIFQINLQHFIAMIILDMNGDNN